MLLQLPLLLLGELGQPSYLAAQGIQVLLREGGKAHVCVHETDEESAPELGVQLRGQRTGHQVIMTSVILTIHLNCALQDKCLINCVNVANVCTYFSNTVCSSKNCTIISTVKRERERVTVPAPSLIIAPPNILFLSAARQVRSLGLHPIAR